MNHNSRQGTRELLSAAFAILPHNRSKQRGSRHIRIDINHQAITRPSPRGQPVLGKGPRKHKIYTGEAHQEYQ